jgi:Conjugal transfer protein
MDQPLRNFAQIMRNYLSRYVYHDDKFTYIKTSAPEKFSIYEMRDGKPNLVNYELRDGTYIIPKVMDSGYVELGKKRMDFARKE